jgi:hypothetical protein
MPPKNKNRYPTLNKDQVEAITSHVLACMEDFANGQESMKEMAKISDEEWITSNLKYFTHCLSASNYILDKMRVKKVGA